MGSVLVYWLAALVGAPTPATPPPALPAVGWVRLADLVAADPVWARVETLRLQAEQMRLAAEQVGPLVLPPVPPDQITLPPGGESYDEDLSRRAAAMELQILREAHLSQIAAARRRALTYGLPALQRAWLADLRDERLAYAERVAGMAEAQGQERTNLSLHLDEAGAAGAAPWDVERAALESAEAAVAAQWSVGASTGATMRLRDGLRQRAAELDEQDRQALAQADADIAVRRAEQAAAAQRLATARGSMAAGHGEPVLDLNEWRSQLAAALSEGSTQRATRVAGWRQAADELTKRADQWQAELRTQLPERLAGDVRALAVAAGVRIDLEERPGEPEVTALVGRWLRGMAEHPEWFVAPMGEEGF